MANLGGLLASALLASVLLLAQAEASQALATEVAQQYLSYLRPPPATSRHLDAASQRRWAQQSRSAERHLLAQTKQAAVAENGVGMVEYKPVGYTINSEDFTDFFRKAHGNRKVTGMRVPQGTYHVTADVENANHIYLPCNDDRQEPFEIDFTGIFFYFTDYQQSGITMTNCSNIDMHGPYEQTWVNDQLDFTQGIVVGVDEDALVYTVEVDDEYPSDRVMLNEGIAVILFHNDTLLVKNPDPYQDIIVGGTDGRKKLGPKTYSFTALGLTPNVTVGDYFVARGNASTVGIRFDHNINCTARDFSMYHAGGFGIFQAFGRNNSFINVQVRPFPYPLGKDGKLPLLSTVADIFHSTSAHSGTLLKNNYFVNSGDDAIAMSGGYVLVATKDPSTKSVVLASDRDYSFNPGDLLTFYAADTRWLGTVNITDMYSVDQPDNTQGKGSKQLQNFDYDEADYMKVVLADWPEDMNLLQFDDVVSSPSNNGDGFAIVNNTVGNLRGRGALVKSSNGVIAGNRFFNLKGWGIEMAPEYIWVEADFVHNVLVADNVVNSYAMGMWLGIDPYIYGTPSLYTNNYNVDFVNNTIANCGSMPFLLTSAAQISIVNTTFMNVLCTQKDTTVYPDWQVQGAIVMVANVEDVTFSGNAILKDARCKQVFGNYASPVTLVNATNVRGLAPRVPVSSMLQRDDGP